MFTGVGFDPLPGILSRSPSLLVIAISVRCTRTTVDSGILCQVFVR